MRGKHPNSRNGFKKGHPNYLKTHSVEAKRKIGIAGIGRPSFWKGRKLPQEIRLKMSVSHKKRREQSHLWKGGKTEEGILIRSGSEYRLWREAVFKRDNYACIWGGKAHGNKLQADHIKPFYLFPELRFAIDNGTR